MPVNPRKAAFKSLIVEALEEDTARQGRTRTELVAFARAERPDLFDDAPCSSGCHGHEFLWQHQFDRCIFDLRHLHPPKIVSYERSQGVYYRP